MLKTKKQSYQVSVKKRVGQELIKAPHGTQVKTALVLRVTTRTLRNWKKASDQVEVRRGPKSKSVPFSTMIKIVREWERQCRPGALAVFKRLGNVALRLIRRIIAELKKRIKKRARIKKQKVRTTVVVQKPGAITAMDGAHLKDNGGDHIVHRDRASISTHVSPCETEHQQASDTLNLLKRLKEQNRLPLVLQTDNGPGFCAHTVEDFLNINKVVHLKSLPYVPEQNGSAENAVGDVKRGVALGITPEQVCTALNTARLRRTLGYQTAQAVEEKCTLEWKENIRDQFYKDASSAIEHSQLGTKSAYEKRKCEREAIFQTLEKYSLITRTRGSKTDRAKAEINT